MNRRALLIALLALCCLAMLCGVVLQGRQLAGLRAEERQSLAQLAPTPDGLASAATAEPATGSLDRRLAVSSVPSELLRLRSDVTRLTERRRELAGVRAENERLRAQFASQGTNAAAVAQPPPGYVRRAEARLVGYNTPEDTIQSLLWAIVNHDATNFLQAFTPRMAELMRTNALRSVEDYFRGAEVLPGVAIVSREEGDDGPGSLDVEVEFGPDEPHEDFTLQQVNGQWKIGE
jgi:hypothetical protein